MPTTPPAADLPAQRVYLSASNPSSTFHLRLDCEALAIIASYGRDPVPYLSEQPVSSWKYFQDVDRRACRACALEPVASVLMRRIGTEPATFASCTSQVPLAETAFTRTGKLRASYRDDALTAFRESSAERLRRIADACGFSMVSTVAGPAMYGHLPVRAAHFTELNLRTSFGPAAAEDPSPAVVSFAWALLCNQPPEILAHFGDEQLIDDPWTLAVAAAG